MSDLMKGFWASSIIFGSAFLFFISNTSSDADLRDARTECKCAYVPEPGFFKRVTHDPVAIATLLLVAVTGSLAVSTRNAAVAAKDAADALPKIERAYVFVEVSIGEFALAGTDDAIANIRVRFINLGKTPAIPKRIRAYPVVQQAIPDALNSVPSSERQLPPSYVIPAGDGFPLNAIELKRKRTEMTEISDGTMPLFCVGQIEYSDVLGAHRETGFCWRYDSVGRRLVPAESKLNYYT